VSYGKDLRRVFSFAVPASAINLVNFLVQFTSVLFVGRLGADYLGAAALANMLSNLTGYSVGFGATTALDALCSQAYGARSFKLVGRHTQRAMLILSLATIPVAFIWWQTGTILGWMGVEARICDLADDYTRILIGGTLHSAF
jgi:MATE family multidrug resistance protein